MTYAIARVMSNSYDETNDVLDLEFEMVIVAGSLESNPIYGRASVNFNGSVRVTTGGDWLAAMKVATRLLDIWNFRYNQDHAGDSPVCRDVTGLLYEVPL